MHATNIKIIGAQHAKICNIYKNTRLKLLKTNTAIWFKKMCKIKHQKPNYIQFRTRGKKPQDKKTTSNMIKFRINQEIKFLYCKKQSLNTQLYQIHLECANQCNKVWQHIQDYIDGRLNEKMDTLYQKLNKKLDGLSKQHQATHHNNKNMNTTPRLINLTNITFTREHTHILTMGPNYALEKDPKRYANELIIDTENAIRQLEPKIQNTFSHMASRKIKQILTTNMYRPMHKRHQHNIKQIKNMLQRNNLTIARADKNKAIVVISKDALEQKIMTFIQENQIACLNKDPTECFQKEIQQALQKCDTLIEKSKHKYLMNIKPTAPHLNAYIKTHKQNRPI